MSKRPYPGDNVLTTRGELFVVDGVSRDGIVRTFSAEDSARRRRFRLKDLEDVDDELWQEVER